MTGCYGCDIVQKLLEIQHLSYSLCKPKARRFQARTKTNELALFLLDPKHIAITIQYFTMIYYNVMEALNLQTCYL